jgi:hypothetical protein
MGALPSALPTVYFPTHISRHSHRYARFSLSARQSCVIMPPHWKKKGVVKQRGISRHVGY